MLLGIAAPAAAAPAILAQAGPSGAAPADADPIGDYLTDLERAGRLRGEEASLARLEGLLEAAETRLVQGDVRGAASGLFLIVESPRFAPWKDSVPFQNAEYLLGRALARGGGATSAERYLVRVLARGRQGPYFVPAHRTLVDLALAGGDFSRLLAVLEKVAPRTGLPEDAAAERAYLRGRAAYEAGDLAAAAAALVEVGRTSRLYASAAYFRGLIAARRRDFANARGAFCEILPGKEGATLAFTIDGRYYKLQDLARLALARIAHEQDRYDEAYYFYFSVPEDSDRLAEALFEAAWSMYQKGETEAAQAFIDDFDRLFPDSPLRPDVGMLRATVAVKSCAFNQARAEASGLVKTYSPAQKLASRALAEPPFARRLAHRLLGRPESVGPGGDAEGRLLTLLKLDARFGQLAAMVQDLDTEIREAEEAAVAWQELGARLVGGQAVTKAASSPEAAALREEVARLLSEAEREPELRQRAMDLLGRVSRLSHPPSPNHPYAAEVKAARSLAESLRALRDRTQAGAQGIVTASLRELDERLRGIFRQVRLVHIDAVVGRKKRLEVEIANLRAGRLTPELYAKMKAEGTLGDDEEYWPFEGEYWADEYENYR